MIKSTLFSLLALTAGIGTVPSQDGTPLAQTAVTATLEALEGRVSDLEARVASLEGSPVQASQAASVSESDLQVALATLAPGETLVAINGVPVSGYAQAPQARQFQPVRQVVQAQPVQQVQQRLQQVVQPRRVFQRFGAPRYSTCGPNGCN